MSGASSRRKGNVIGVALGSLAMLAARAAVVTVTVLLVMRVML